MAMQRSEAAAQFDREPIDRTDLRERSMDDQLAELCFKNRESRDSLFMEEFIHESLLEATAAGMCRSRCKPEQRAVQAGTKQAGILPGFPISQPVIGAQHQAPAVSQNEAMLAPCACQSCDNNGQTACDAAPSCGCGQGDGSCGCGLGLGLGLGGCDGGCDSACGCDDGILGLGLVKKTDLCYDDFISPMTNPTYFEDPRNLSELRFIYAHHNVPVAAGGGDVNLFAMQFRARLTDKLSLIATKDGYMTTSNPLLDDGWMGVNAGLKYNFYADPVAGVLYSSGVTYEIPMGSTRNYQNYGNGQFHFFTSHGRRIGCNMHWITAIGSRIPADDNLQNRMIYWSNHLDYRVTQKLYAFTELNWYNWASSGNGPLNGVEGGDLFSLGSSNVTGNDIVTQGVGFKYKRKQNRELGFVYEFPLTERRDVLKDRVTVDYIIRY